MRDILDGTLGTMLFNCFYDFEILDINNLIMRHF